MGFFEWAVTKIPVVVAGATLSVYLLNSPFPNCPDLDPGDVRKLRLLILKNRLYSYLAQIGGWTGLTSSINIIRKLYRFEATLSLRGTNPDIYVDEYQVFKDVRVLIYRKLSWMTDDDDEEAEEENGEVSSRRNSPQRRPAVIYYHGGGWCVSSPDEREHVSRYLLDKLDVIIFAVDYRKAPENPFPAAFEDCVAVAKHVFINHMALGVDKDKIAVCGDSAGGNLATAVALKLRDESKNFLKAQVLIYPSVQFLNFRTSSYLRKFPLLTARSCVHYALVYSGEPLSLEDSVLENEHLSDTFFEQPAFQAIQKYESFVAPLSKSLVNREMFTLFRRKIMNPYMCPLMARTMRNLPSALIVVCDYDVLMDDGLAYADRLRTDGVVVTLAKVAAYHGAFRDFTFMKCGEAIMEKVVDYLRDQLEL